MSWSIFEQASPELAESGRRLLGQTISIGFISTCSKDRPRIAPVCPIFSEDDIYICAAEHSPKVSDLRSVKSYSLHAFLGEGDEEFQCSGSAIEVTDSLERASVHAAIPFGSFNKQDPIFRLSVDKALWAYWERVGQPDTIAIRKRWPHKKPVIA